VCDVQHLYDAAGEGLVSSLEQIPKESLGGFHVHYNNRCPSLSDPIPWEEVFGHIQGLERPIFINTEIHDANRVKDAVAFCRGMLK
jgi:hypothetical protein